MTKRELIEALEALECSDTTIIAVLDDEGFSWTLPEPRLVLDTCEEYNDLNEDLQVTPVIILFDRG